MKCCGQDGVQRGGSAPAMRCTHKGRTNHQRRCCCSDERIFMGVCACEGCLDNAPSAWESAVVGTILLPVSSRPFGRRPKRAEEACTRRPRSRSSSRAEEGANLVGVGGISAIHGARLLPSNARRMRRRGRPCRRGGGISNALGPWAHCPPPCSLQKIDPEFSFLLFCLEDTGRCKTKY